jgi:T-complex protein 1 subunit delta
MSGPKEHTVKDRAQEKSVRESNIVAAKAVADAVRTSLGPRGMDKMISSPKGEVVITNDGATILKQMEVAHPTAKMLVDLSKSQDVEAGDGTTTVTVIAGSLLNQAQILLEKGIHPTVISESFLLAARKSEEILKEMSMPVDLGDRDELIKAATTSLNSKVISNNSDTLAPLAVDAMLKVIDPATATNVDLNDIAVVKKLGGTIDDTQLVDGLVFTQRARHSAGGIGKVANAKIGLIQFCLSAPKTDIEQNVVVSDYSQMDRILKEERQYILNMCKKIKASGCNVLLVQKSILRDAVNDLSLHFLAKMKILVVTDIERDDIEFISKTCGCLPVANVDTFHAEKLGKADLVEEKQTGEGKVVMVTGVPNSGKTVTLFCKASNKLVLDESERSLHDALCVLRCLVKQRFICPGGGAPEMQVSYQLSKWANGLEGMHQYCVRAYAEAMEVVPYTLAENAGLNAIQVVTELRNRHSQGESAAGINVRKGRITNIMEENVIVPLLVHTSAITLATECVRLILKIDDIVITR